MPSNSQCIEAISRMQKKTPSAAFCIHGPPGCGKTDACHQIAVKVLPPNTPADRILSLYLGDYMREDFAGCPEIVATTHGRTTKFQPSDIFARFAKGTGPGYIILEEVKTCDTDIQQYVSQLIEERSASNFELDPEVRILATGNRSEDKAGAKEMLSQLNDRFWHTDMETSVDDWCAYEIERGKVDPLGIAFIRLRPELLHKFDPALRSNPTHRSWSKLLSEVPTDMPTDLYMMIAEGKVGEGAAAEWVSARDMMHKMPSVDAVRMQPDKVEIPTEPAVCYAISTGLSMTATQDTFPRDMTYITRMRKEFQMVYVSDVLRADPELAQTKTFIDWSVKNQDIFKGG